MTNRQPHPEAYFQLSGVDEDRVLLVIRDRNIGATWTIPMAACGAGQWARTVTLPPGSYESRYYAGDERRMIYYGPAHAGAKPGGCNGLDGVFKIELTAAPKPLDWSAPPRPKPEPVDQASRLRTLLAELEVNAAGVAAIGN